MYGMYLTYTTKGDLSGLPAFIQQRIKTDISVCGYIKGNISCQELKTINTEIYT